DNSIIIHSNEQSNNSITDYKNIHKFLPITPTPTLKSSPSALPDRPRTRSPKRVLVSSHLHPESLRKRVTYPESSNVFLGRGSLGMQEDGRLSVVMSCVKHSPEQRLNIWQKHCQNLECTQQRMNSSVVMDSFLDLGLRMEGNMFGLIGMLPGSWRKVFRLLRETLSVDLESEEGPRRLPDIVHSELIMKA
ncbi:hypothetical protein ACJ73_06745, partial [Blastomyces percursus]